MVPRSRNAMNTQPLDAVVNIYGSASAFSKRTNHSHCCCVSSTEGYDFLEARVRPLRWTVGGSARRVRKDVMGP